MQRSGRSGGGPEDLDDGLQWGRDSWTVLHLACLRWDEQAASRPPARRVEDFVHMFRRLLLCLPCRQDFLKLLAELPPPPPPPIPGGGQLFAWSVEAHNRVNRRLGKPAMPLEQARQMYGTLSRDPARWGPYFWRYMHRLAAFSEHPNMEMRAEDVHEMLCTWIPLAVPDAAMGQKYRDILVTRYLVANQTWSEILHRLHNYYNMNEAKCTWNGNPEQQYANVLCGTVRGQVPDQPSVREDKKPNVLPILLGLEGLVLLGAGVIFSAAWLHDKGQRGTD